MKKLLLILLVLAMTLSVFASCNGKKDENTPAPTDAPTEQPTEQPTEKPTDENEDNKKPEYETITVAKALELCGEEPGFMTEERYYIRATVLSIDNAQYGAMTIGDDTGTISVYGTYSADGSIGYAAMEEKPYKGDEVLLHCILQNYNGTKEVQNARLIEFKKGRTEVNEADYTEMSVADARGTEVGKKVKVDGVVAKITYADGMIPMGIYLVDDTNSIYVYDSDLAQRVAIGNKITILASKTYWILASEKANAEKFGYQGCCQLEEVTLLSNDEQTNEVDLSWVEESSVKEILETPVSQSITTTIFKVDALVKKVEGTGFTNYYFYDIDGTTGSYTYTQCSGADFAWLDEFDGKICTVYLSVINAKSTATDCFFRLLPIAVIDENYTFDLNEVNNFVLEYHVLDQLQPSYSADPAITLITSVSSELLGFEGATVSYSSNNTDVVYIENNDGTLVLHCKNPGNATIVITCEYNGKSSVSRVDLTVEEPEEFETITIADAKDKQVGEEVIIKGIVGPSVVNKSGFYLFDETGMVTITVNGDVFDKIAIGNEVILKGKRDVFKEDGKTHAGQIAISNCELLANNYGDHDYHTFDFTEGKDLAYIAGLDVNEQYSDQVFVITATIDLVSTPYYTSLKLTDGETSLNLYSSSANQYPFLLELGGQEVTIEIAPCNWNDKSGYAGCVLAVETQDGWVLNTWNFD